MAAKKEIHPCTQCYLKEMKCLFEDDTEQCEARWEHIQKGENNMYREQCEKCKKTFYYQDVYETETGYICEECIQQEQEEEIE